MVTAAEGGVQPPRTSSCCRVVAGDLRLRAGRDDVWTTVVPRAIAAGLVVGRVIITCHPLGEATTCGRVSWETRRSCHLWRSTSHPLLRARSSSAWPSSSHLSMASRSTASRNSAYGTSRSSTGGGGGSSLDRLPDEAVRLPRDFLSRASPSSRGRPEMMALLLRRLRRLLRLQRVVAFMVDLCGAAREGPPNFPSG